MSDKVESELAIVRLKKELEDLYFDIENKKDNPIRAILFFLLSFIPIGLFIGLIISIIEYGLTFFKIGYGFVLLLIVFFSYKKVYFLLNNLRKNPSREIIIAKEIELQKHRSIVAGK
jgi:hypothetical protein